jgi:hypothetical protein
MTTSPILRPCPLELRHSRDELLTGGRARTDPSHRRIRRGVYADASEWDALTSSERYLARVHAYASIRPGAVFSHESAAALLALPLFGEPRDIHVHDPRRRSSTRYGDVCVHTGRDSRGTLAVGDLRTVDPLDIVVDLARALPPALGLAVADAALFHRLVDDGKNLTERLSERIDPRRRARAEWVCRRADAASESPGESISRAVIEWCGFAPPALQAVFRNEGREDRSDFFWPAARVIGEFDGAIKYDADTASEIRRTIVAEKWREDRLRRHVGTVVRWGWQDAVRAMPLRERLLAAGVPITGRPRPALLSSVANNPRSLPRPARPAYA